MGNDIIQWLDKPQPSRKGNPSAVRRSRSMERVDSFSLRWKWEGRCPSCDWFLSFKTSWCPTAPIGGRDSTIVWRPRSMERLDPFTFRWEWKGRRLSCHRCLPIKTSCSTLTSLRKWRWNPIAVRGHWGLGTMGRWSFRPRRNTECWGSSSKLLEW